MVTELDRRRMADAAAVACAVRSPPAQAGIAFVQTAARRLRMSPGSLAINRLAQNVGHQWPENDPRNKGRIVMPGGDRTAPVGMGPMTGRAAGYCAGHSVPGFVNPVPGGGFWGWGRGGGRGWRNWYYATGLTGGQRAALGLPAFGVAGAYAAPFAWPFGPAP